MLAAPVQINPTHAHSCFGTIDFSVYTNLTLHEEEPEPEHAVHQHRHMPKLRRGILS